MPVPDHERGFTVRSMLTKPQRIRREELLDAIDNGKYAELRITPTDEDLLDSVGLEHEALIRGYENVLDYVRSIRQRYGIPLSEANTPESQGAMVL